MNDRPHHEDTLAEKANAAFVFASVTVIEKARATSTPVIIWRDGKIVHLTPDEAEQLLQEHIEKSAS